MLILGVDPGTAITGYGLVRGEPLGPYALVECGVIRTRARDPLSARLLEIYDGIRGIVGRHAPAAIAVEDVFYARNVRTTVALGHARGVVLLAAEQARVPIHEYSPASVKKGIAGRGAATKEQVQFMVARLLRLKSAPAPSDAADGVAVALCCLMEGSRYRPGSAAPGARHRTAAIDTVGAHARRLVAAQASSTR